MIGYFTVEYSAYFNYLLTNKYMSQNAAFLRLKTTLLTNDDNDVYYKTS